MKKNPTETPDYEALMISRPEIIADMVKRLQQAERLQIVVNTLKSNVYKACKKCGIAKQEVIAAKQQSDLANLADIIPEEIDPQDLANPDKA